MAGGARGNGIGTNEKAVKGNCTRFYGSNKAKGEDSYLKTKAVGENKKKGK